MQYKTILLELIEAQPTLRNRLQQQRQLLSTIELHAPILRQMHLDWLDRLQREQPDLDRRQASSMALDLALNQWQTDHPWSNHAANHNPDHPADSHDA